MIPYNQQNQQNASMNNDIMTNTKIIYNQNTNPQYVDYVCLNQFRTETDIPWYPRQDICPCNPKYNNITGRGYTMCPFGVEFNQQEMEQRAISMHPVQTLEEHQGLQGYFTTITDGSNVINETQLFPKYTYAAPQMWPRPNTRIGQDWRSAN